MRWKVRSCLPRLLLLSASASALTSLEQIEKNALPCPDACLGKGPADWSLYPSADKLAACPQPLLLSLGLSTAFDDEKTDSPIRACTLGNAKTKVNYLVESDYVDPEAMGKTNFGSVRRRAAEVNSTCGAGPSEKLETPIRLSSFDTSIEPLGKDPGADVILATKTITHHLEKARASCEKTILFAYIRGTLVGLYAGSQVDRRKTIDALLPTFVQALQGGSDVRQAVEACDEGPASDVFGLIADPTGDFVAVQAAVKSWNEGKCVAGGKGSKTKDLSKLTAWGYTLAANARGHSARSLDARDTCRSIEAENGDTCETLAKRCGVSLASFESANKATKDLCDKTPAGQPVCCSSGELPSIKAKIQSNGVCTSYDTKMGDICDTIAAKHGITVEDLENWNKKTWAWDGCGNLNPYVRICVSAGDPPMPASVWNAECGPTKNDTKPPGEGEELADLNPCPLNVCCNRWGMCGLTDEFCLKSTSNTGNPGTGQPGEGGCISNCERKLTNNGKAPEKYRKIGYFEAWNYDRPCQHMHVLDIDKSYSHIHFSFGEISQGLQVVIPDRVKEQFEAFKKAADLPAKKILAFGGWAFSNEAADTSLFRKAFSAGNREAFASRVVDFVSKNNLDGVDFDWEYPGATDIEGSDPGQKDDGDNYYEFLKVLRGKLPKDKSLSIAAPASYWYLKGFPIKKMAPLLDYIIFMTYDLHGQWDVGSKWASPGCPAGNCLRSHVNSTETMDSLIMITKAGVESHKVVVGVSSYGRSFKMSSSTCRGPQCTYLGERNKSPAKKGRCTGTAGYISDFEINEIIAKGGAIKTWYDEATDSDYLVYEGDEWVAYMSKVTKTRRMRDYMKLNFGGTTDWAIDLQGDFEKRYTSGRPVFLDPKVYETPSAACEAPCTLVFPPSKLSEATTIKPGKFTTSLEYGADGKTTIGGKETTAFITKTVTITVDVPEITTNSMMYSNVNVTQGQKNTDLVLRPSIKVPPIPVRVPDGEGGTTTRTLTLPPYPFSTKRPGSSGTGTTSKQPLEPTLFPTDIRFTQTHTRLPTGDQDTISGLPVYVEWPTGIIEAIEDEVEDIVAVDDGFKSPCKLWYFHFCPPGIKGLRWTIKPGIYPIGPPPPNVIKPDGIHLPSPIRVEFPPWPEITVGPNHLPTYPPKPDCEPDSASLCWTTTTLSPTLVGPSTSTYTTSTTRCETVYGCEVKDWETEYTKKLKCPIPTQVSKRRPDPEDDGMNVLQRRANCNRRAALIPTSIRDPGRIRALLDSYNIQYTEVTSVRYVENGAPATLYIYWWIESIHPGVAARIDQDASVAVIYDFGEAAPVPRKPSPRRDANITSEDEDVARSQAKRAPYTIRTSRDWAAAQVSMPRGAIWKDPDRDEYQKNRNPEYHIASQPEMGRGQFVYVIQEAAYEMRNNEFQGLTYDDTLEVPIYHKPTVPKDQLDSGHGTSVLGQLVGSTKGFAKNAMVYPVSRRSQFGDELTTLGSLAVVLESIVRNNQRGKAVINMSFGHVPDDRGINGPYYDAIRQLLEELDEAGTVIVASSGNTPWNGNDLDLTKLPVDSYPALFGEPGSKGYLPNLIVVGGSTDDGETTDASQQAAWIDTFAPGFIMSVARGVGDGAVQGAGSSYAAPMVAGLVAYMRSIQSKYQKTLEDPESVKDMIKSLSRKFGYWNEYTNAPVPSDDPKAVAVIWNGQSGQDTCFVETGNGPEWCSPNWSPGPGGPGGGADPGGSGKKIEWKPGTDAPKCTSNSARNLFKKRAEATCGGVLCKGYYCTPNPRGPPPDFRDPKDPNRDNDDNENPPGPGPVPTPVPTPGPARIRRRSLWDALFLS